MSVYHCSLFDALPLTALLLLLALLLEKGKYWGGKRDASRRGKRQGGIFK
jgi:hypothetical protein